ncbi:MAG TPA: triple tyrosine motif-containing protein [Flavobacterium sp.]|jgi:ligand-binding sensor domain-containing protein/DNA-binding CsgD family transcriptional regulator
MLNSLLKLLLLVSCFSYAQELAPIINYDAETYKGGNQNWMIGQNKDQYIYVANNEGLLEYNGATWSLYRSPNETIFRSVKVIGDVIYTGCYMEFGYWQRNRKGVLEYTSLSQQIKSGLIDDEQFWNILSYDHWVIFQSLNRIYIYDTTSKSFKIITSANGILKAFKTVDSIYYQTVDGEVYEIENGKSKLMIPPDVLQTKRIVNIFNTSEGILLQTQSHGFFSLVGNQLNPFLTQADALLSNTTIYNSLLLADGSFALGSISNGIFIISPKGALRYHITQSHGLGNNTILSLFEDADKNLWMGLDNGISCINMASPIKSFSDNTGILGTVYTSIVHEGNLYIGTNQGLFYKKRSDGGEFQFISGTKGQVWSLFTYDNTVFCGHDHGTFIVTDKSASMIYNGSGTWKFEVNPARPGEIIQGNYSGLSILKKSGGKWTFQNKISGFNYSSKYFEVLGSSIYVSHEYKGIFRLQMDPQFSKAISYQTYKYPGKGKNASLAKYNNRILYAYKEGVFRLDPKTNTFEKDPVLSKVVEKDEYTSGKMIVDESDKLWIFTKHSINYFTLGKLSSVLKMNAIPIPSSLSNSMLGYENISHLGNSHYLVGTTDGYYLLNINNLKFNRYKINITSVTSNKLDAEAQNITLGKEDEIPYKQNNLTFSYTVPEYNKYVVAEYQYVLDGLSDNWSDWSEKATVAFKNLPYGRYRFKVRARIGNGLSENTAVYNFTVLRPWYATYLAIFCYLLIALIAAWFIHKTYKSHYQRQNEKLLEENRRHLELKQLESEQQLMKVKNEQLLQDVENKNRELAVSTMNLIRKNEFLSLIKDDLKKTDDSSRNIKTVIATINKNISEEDTWDLFKEAFNNADKDFLKKIKLAHPSLTPNDLRLCAYLRLNLASKEIAPLLNISVRSVEIKRYRLRKKMELDHEQGLVEYILAV